MKWNIQLSTRQVEDALYEVSDAEGSHGVSEVFPLTSSVHEVMASMASARAGAELVVRIKMVIIVTSKVVLLLLLLLSAAKEESLLGPVGVQKVVLLSSCSWMTNIFTERQMGSLKCYGLATLSLADGNIAIKVSLHHLYYLVKERSSVNEPRLLKLENIPPAFPPLTGWTETNCSQNCCFISRLTLNYWEATGQWQTPDLTILELQRSSKCLIVLDKW